LDSNTYSLLEIARFFKQYLASGLHGPKVSNEKATKVGFSLMLQYLPCFNFSAERAAEPDFLEQPSKCVADLKN
jgi:hypothetical protein